MQTTINKGIKKNILLLLFLIMSVKFYSQVKEFDKLEMLYDQQHYKKVYKKSIKLLNKPEFDYSLLPLYYKTLSSMQLAKNEYWLKKNSISILEAEKNFKYFKSQSDGKLVWNSHFYELSFFKRDMMMWLEYLKASKNDKLFQQINNIIEVYLSEIPDIKEINNDEVVGNIKTENLSKNISDKIIDFAVKFIGVPYSYNGDSPSGFDCSGFTSYVFKENKIEIPRNAAEQYNKSKHLNVENVKKGDLIFFSNGSRISHVGIIISSKGEDLKMIHSSSTNGIIITEIENSSYWKKRIAGFGTFLK